MIFYILRRILYAIPIAFGVSVVCFSLVYIAPGDPLQTVMPPDATAETIAIVKHAYGFDKPLPMQFVIWLGRVVTGDFGLSIATRRPVFLEVTDALANTALLALFPSFSRLRLMRHWGGIMDMTMDGSPIIGKTPIEGLYIDGGWCYGGFKATPASGWVFAHTIANDHPHPLNEAFSLERFATGAVIDEKGAGPVPGAH